MNSNLTAIAGATVHTNFNERSFASVIRAGDSRRFNVNLAAQRKTVIDAAIATANDKSFSFGPIKSTPIKGRDCSSISDYSQNLVLRLTSKHITRRLKIELKNRDRIVKSVIESLSDSTPIYILRRDISSFYESIPIAIIKEKMSAGTYLPATIKKFINAYFSDLCANSSQGIPRGIPLSPIFAEISMIDFDNTIRSLDGVYRYFRYSDDILVMSYKDPIEIEKALVKHLPAGMKFNKNKEENIELICKSKERKIEKSFEYLGYKYTMSDLSKSKEPREIKVSIADKKISKIKTRIFCSLKSYAKDKNFNLLHDRIRFLAGNITVLRHGASAVKTSRQVKSGIYYNYKLCGIYNGSTINSHGCNELKSLDAFYYSLLKNSKNIGAQLNKIELDKLKVISFYKGYSLKHSFNLKPSKMATIKRAWRNV